MKFLSVLLRRVVREKFYSMVCILSLALGFASALLIGLYLYSELSFDHFHHDHERLYRVGTQLDEVGISLTGYEVGEYLTRNYPQFQQAMRLRDAPENRFRVDDLSNEWESVYLSDPAIFDMLTFNILSGDRETALADPNSIAVSESFARFYFGDKDPVGRVISTERVDLEVTLLYEDLPENVTYRYDALIPFNLLEFYEPNYWENINNQFFAPPSRTLVSVSQGFDPAIIEEASQSLFNEHLSGEFQNLTGGVDLEYKLLLHQMDDMHFTAGLVDSQGVGNIQNLMIFGMIAVGLLLISCINYVNLATARAAQRNKEVAMRKILGANSQRLISQFLLESVVFVGLSLSVALGAAYLATQLGYVESLTGKAQLAQLLLTPGALLVLLVGLIVISVAAGFYPALKLSSPSMLSIFRPEYQIGPVVLSLRQLLVLLQMAVSITIIACALLMSQQADYLQEAPLGFRKENQLVVDLQGGDAIRSRQAVMTELLRHSDIDHVAATQNVLGTGISISIQPIEDNNGISQMVTTNPFSASATFLDTMEIALLRGRMFRDDQSNNEVNPIIVNETMVNHLGWEEPLGKQIGSRTVIGVMQDFHYRPMHEEIGPVYILPYGDGFLEGQTEQQYRNADVDLVINHNGRDLSSLRNDVEAIVREITGNEYIEIETLENIWRELYATDTQVLGLARVFAIISILISILGVAGLATYGAQQRARELAIRKVLGASTYSLLKMLSANLLRLLVIAFVPAVFATLYFSQTWMGRYAYTADFSVYPYFLAFLAVGLLGLLVQLLQSWQLARRNPVFTLRQ
ncbi:MAG: ABC transporter permease [Pseudomonadales bacterium]|nr:ABC transporter permease [Pseudomonadales bacterium]